MVGIIIQNVLTILIYMLFGFLLCKSKKASVEDTKGFSGLLIYVCSPGLIIGAFLNLDSSKENLANLGIFAIITLLGQLLFIGLFYLIFNKKYENAKYRILTIGATLGNVGYIGMPLISSIFPNDPIVSCYSAINVMTMNVIVFTIGVYCLTNDKKFISLKTVFMNPTSISIGVALVICLLKIQLPDILLNTCQLLSKMTMPVGVIILGMRLSACDFKKLFTRPFMYLIAVLKLVGFPIFMYILTSFLPINELMRTTIVILSMAPTGAVIQSLAEIHNKEQELAANVILLATLLCVITIPLMAYILVN